MTPILGVIASGISGHLAPPDVFQGNYWSLNSTTLTTSTSSVTFSGIPQNYTHLQVRSFQANTVGAANLRISFNGDTTSVYTYHGLYGAGGATGSFGGNTDPYSYLGNGRTTYYAQHVTDILDYTNTNKNKVYKTMHGYEAAGTGIIELLGGLYLNLLPITSITLTAGTNSFTANSSFALYGVK